MRYGLPAANVGRFGFLAEIEFGVHQNAPERHFDPVVEIPTLVAALLVEAHQHFRVLIGEGRRKARRASVETICLAQAASWDRVGWAAGENLAAGLGVGRPLGIVGAIDTDLAHVGKELESGKAAGLDGAAQEVLVRDRCRAHNWWRGTSPRRCAGPLWRGT